MKSQNIHYLYAFTLGREWKLSLAELLSIFGEDSYRSHNETIALLSIEALNSTDIISTFRKIGGSVRVIEILDETDERRFATDVITYLQDSKPNKEEWGENTRTKITFALGAYSVEFRLSDIGLRIKKTLQENGKSARLVNTENENINAASFKKERLSKNQNEFNIIALGNTVYIGRTLVCQDIDAYTHRDTAKSRDMIVGMMPPKLAQILINLALNWKNIVSSDEIRNNSKMCIYDPFCGLGTTLIEAANMGITELLGSDLSPQMVRSTRESLDTFVAEEKMWQERIIAAWWKPNKDFSSMHYDIFELDAMKIFRHFEGKKIENTVIVSEWYLGAIMQKESITIDKVKSERLSLMRMYDAFFRGLKNLGFKWNIVMTFPFWDIRGNCSYFTEIYDVLEDAWYQIIPLLPHRAADLLTKKWSLLYQRPGQNVGREVIKIQLKK